MTNADKIVRMLVVLVLHQFHHISDGAIIFSIFDNGFSIAQPQR
jgi:hypothetical protein